MNEVHKHEAKACYMSAACGLMIDATTASTSKVKNFVVLRLSLLVTNLLSLLLTFLDLCGSRGSLSILY